MSDRAFGHRATIAPASSTRTAELAVRAPRLRHHLTSPHQSASKMMSIWLVSGFTHIDLNQKDTASKYKLFSFEPPVIWLNAFKPAWPK